jgi:hypothetical protein
MMRLSTAPLTTSACEGDLAHGVLTKDLDRSWPEGHRE